MRFPVFLLRRREDAPEAPWLRAAVGVYLEHLVQRPYHGFPVRLPVHPEPRVIEDGQRQPHEVFHKLSSSFLTLVSASRKLIFFHI